MIILVTVLVFGMILFKVIERDFYFDEKVSLWPLSKVFWFLFGSFTFQGPNMSSLNRFPSRLLVTVWWFSILILVSCYTGLLMSFLTYPLNEGVPSTFQELALAMQEGKYSCIFLPGSDVPRFLMGSKSGSGKILANYIKKNLTLVNDDDVLRTVLNSRVAFLNTVYMIKEMIKQYGSGKYVISEDSIVTFTVAYALRKGFPYRNEINKIIIRLFEAGLSDRDEVLLNVVTKGATSEFQPLTVEDILSPLALLILGYILSIFCFLLEMIIFKFGDCLSQYFEQFSSDFLCSKNRKIRSL
ncbi:ionotropic receptor 21a-like [Centruroides vittatus]|uniref:ionotropic receptor 21a-like n=1 Tax=Centruroides vittatus TaxID=120091 RepID=UPI00350FDA6B